MGAGQGKWYEPGAPPKDGTTLVQLHIENISDAHGLVGERPMGVYTPMVLTPRHSQASCCCIPCCFVSIPQGFSAIVTQFGAEKRGDADDGTWTPGCHCLSPLSEVSHLVTKQLVIFDTPVKDCKTKDAITVNLDVMIVFEVLQATTFQYSIGPDRFDDLLRATQDEALRAIANETLVDSIYDLHGQNTQDIVEDMNKKFDKFGVRVLDFTVKNVQIPRDMAQDFEDKTLFESKTTMKQMQQESDRLRLNNEEGKQKLKEECDNARMAAEQNAQVVKTQAIKETSEVDAQTKRDIAELKSQRDVEVQQVLANAELDISKMKSQILSIEREIKTRTSADCGRLDAEAQAYAKQKQADAKIAVAEKMAKGKKALGEAEGEAAQAFVARRGHEAEMQRLKILEQLVNNEGIQIATTQENSVGLSQENAVVTQVAQQGLEALRAKLAEITATSLAKLEQTKPGQHAMRASR